MYPHPPLIKEENKILIYYFTKKQYIYQLNEFIYDNDNVKLFSLDIKPIHSLDLWIENKYFNYTYTNFYENINIQP